MYLTSTYKDGFLRTKILTAQHITEHLKKTQTSYVCFVQPFFVTEIAIILEEIITFRTTPSAYIPDFQTITFVLDHLCILLQGTISSTGIDRAIPFIFSPG